MTDPGEITRLLHLVASGNETAAGDLMRQTYDELRRLAGAHCRRERPDLTLQATELVHEVYLRMVRGHESFNDRAHYFRVASRMMHNLLVDHARNHTAKKRGGNHVRVPIDDFLLASDEEAEQILWIDQALERLQRVHPRPAQVVELRFFCGLTIDEIGECLGISGKTADRDWAIAKAWLRGELAGSGNPPEAPQ